MSIEGTGTSQWVLMDFGDVVTHVFRADIRDHYGLEKLWRDAARLRLPTAPVSLSPGAPRTGKSRSVRARRQA